MPTVNHSAQPIKVGRAGSVRSGVRRVPLSRLKPVIDPNCRRPAAVVLALLAGHLPHDLFPGLIEREPLLRGRLRAGFGRLPAEAARERAQREERDGQNANGAHIGNP
jgi:hypothetical protein